MKLVQCLAADLGPFYREVLPQWHATARAVAVATMAGMRPEEVASEVWTERTAELAEAVVAEFIAEDAVAGVAIRLETGNEEEADPTEINVVDPKYFRIGEVAISDVEEWVAAGRDGTAPEGVGKRLDSRDDRKSNLQIAWRVMHAMRLGKGDGLARAIGRFGGAPRAKAPRAQAKGTRKAGTRNMQKPVAMPRGGITILRMVTAERPSRTRQAMTAQNPTMELKKDMAGVRSIVSFSC